MTPFFRPAAVAIAALACTLFAAPLAAQHTAGSVAGIRVEYDARLDKTILHLGRTRVDSVTELSALVVYDGPSTTGRPQNDVVIVTVFLREGAAGKQESTAEAGVYADAEAPLWSGRGISRRPPARGFAETWFLGIPFPDFVRLADAGRLVIVLDGRTIRSGPIAIAAVREYARRLADADHEGTIEGPR